MGTPTANVPVNDEKPGTSATQQCRPPACLHPFPEEMFAAIANCFTRRAEALSAVLGAILTAPGPVDCVAHLSPDHARLHHSGLYAALANGQIDPDAVAALAARVGNTDPLYVDVYSIDATSWLRPSAHTVDGLGRAFDAVGAKKANRPSPAGLSGDRPAVPCGRVVDATVRRGAGQPR